MLYTCLETGVPLINSFDFDVEPIYNGAGFEVIPNIMMSTLDILEVF